MAVALEFIDFIVPIAVIKEKYPGGWEQCLKDHSDVIGGRVWHDEYLLRDGSMGSSGIEYLIEKWTDLGFEPWIEENGIKVWKDCCVTEHVFGGPTRRCDWIEFTEDGRGAFLRGTPPGTIVRRDPL